MPEFDPVLITDGGHNDGADSEKKKNILVELTPDQYEELKETKKKNGFTWLGMLLHAQRCLRREERR